MYTPWVVAGGAILGRFVTVIVPFAADSESAKAADLDTRDATITKVRPT
jgi:hypothetical protein